MSHVKIHIDGSPFTVPAGTTVIGALMSRGTMSWRTTRFGSAPRGAFCGIGVCFDCLLTIDGHPALRSCLVEVAEGMRIDIDHTGEKGAEQ